MSWGEVLFGFHGRINRRTFWSGWVLVSVGGLLLIALLSDLATGDPVSPDIWRAPARKACGCRYGLAGLLSWPGP